MYVFLVSTLLLSGTLSLPSPDAGDGFRRSDLFLDQPYFLGIPNVDNVAVDTFGLDDDSDSGLLNDQLALQGKLRVGKNREKDKSELEATNWPGRKTKVKLQNAGMDVVKAFKENLESQRQQISSLDADSAAQAIDDEMTQCDNNCRGMSISSEKLACILDCATQNKVLSGVSDVLYNGIKTLCHTINTFYFNFDKFKVKNLKTFQAVMKKIEAPMPVSSNVPLRTMLARLINDVFSTMAPFRSMIKKFTEDLTVYETSLNLKTNILVGANPGCSMIDMKKHIQTVLGVVLKDPSLSDYIMLQGYALFTALTKYVDEFPTKKEFSVLNQGLDMMLGTTCGLFVYGSTGETSKCDQIGGYPVLNMPVPQFMWPDDLHVTCQRTKEKMLLNKQKENARRKRESAAAVESTISELKSVVTDESAGVILKQKIRRRRSLIVGKKLS